MDYRTSITYDHRLDEDTADLLLDALQLRAPHMGPVISIDTAAPSFTIVLATTAEDLNAGLAETSFVAGDALNAIGLNVPPRSAEIELASERSAAASTS